MAKTHSKLGTPIAGSFFSAFSYFPSHPACLPVFSGEFWRFYSLISLYLFGFLETTGIIGRFLIRPIYFNRERLCMLRFCCGWVFIRDVCFCLVVNFIGAFLVGALVSFFMNLKSLDTCLHRYEENKNKAARFPIEAFGNDDVFVWV